MEEIVGNKGFLLPIGRRGVTSVWTEYMLIRIVM